MKEMIIAQQEADTLIALEKHYDRLLAANDNPLQLPDVGGKVSVPFTCAAKRERFLIDIVRGRIDLVKETKQLRSRQVVILLRLDVGGAPHRNPDGEEISSPHLHIYREGYGDKWAIPVPRDRFGDLSNSWQTLLDFMSYCNVVDAPIFERGLFT